MKKQFSIFLLIFFVSANINAEISGVSIRDLTQLYNHQIIKVLVGNKLFGHYDDGDIISQQQIDISDNDYA